MQSPLRSAPPAEIGPATIVRAAPGSQLGLGKILALGTACLRSHEAIASPFQSLNSVTSLEGSVGVERAGIFVSTSTPSGDLANDFGGDADRHHGRRSAFLVTITGARR
jgi:hypothetical protein